MTDIKKRLKDIPSIDKIIESGPVAPLVAAHSRERVLEAIRNTLDRFRKKIIDEHDVDISHEAIIGEVESVMSAEDVPSLKRVINATGTIIHTNLGRSVLPEEVVGAVRLAASGTVNLEYDLEKGKRGERDSHLNGLICRLTGAEAATVVNNNAAAVMLVLNSLAKRKEVIVSRGELVEIGGSFRVPDIIRASGCKMVEVGTTNRTRGSDYEGAMSERSGALLKVHTSNYQIVGFTESVEIEELVSIGKRLSVPVVEDLGSGALVDLSPYGLPKEPVVSERIKKGVELVTFSGDKLLGGPQAGIIVGSRELIRKINKNPLKRALRVDKMTVAALEALLKLYLNKEKLAEKLPILRFMTREIGELEKIAKEAAERLNEFFGELATVRIEDGLSEIGSGSLPGEELPTKVVSIIHKRLSPTKLAQLFRSGETPIIGRIQNDRFLLDVRCVENWEELLPVKPA